ncbi:hypothetical protein GFER_08260 [Geoalkalibacter ferrihydriticus DSM 17813]|uniref:Uncharacterized protein n=1 Tax=Geoalkalibacter ferrihydriticus DSM 17813 TaxID=1121915 RepID=A0A0C2EEH9_9BACT|nr:hypothetical protein GFER_08260 [Geoalkalibacter ferrihydriticus DSM 17813]
MKFSRDQIFLLLLALCLVAAMLITLFLGGSRSRHGYGNLKRPVPCCVQTTNHAYLADKGFPPGEQS